MEQQPVTDQVHLSHSQVQEFTWCSMQYYLHRCLNLEPEFAPSSLLFGISVHEALATYHRSLVDGRQPALEELYDVFDRRWEEQPLPVHYSAGESERGLKAIARSLLQTYVREAPRDGEIVGVEEFFRIVLHDDLPPIHGYIDLIERTPEDQLLITDVKTSTRDEPPGPEQLILYSKAVGSLGLSTDPPIRLQYVVLAKKMDAHVSTFPVQVNQEDVDRLTSRYLEVFRAIQDGEFHGNPGSWCSLCQWHSYCDAYQVDLDPMF